MLANYDPAPSTSSDGEQHTLVSTSVTRKEAHQGGQAAIFLSKRQRALTREAFALWVMNPNPSTIRASAQSALPLIETRSACHLDHFDVSCPTFNASLELAVLYTYILRFLLTIIRIFYASAAVRLLPMPWLLLHRVRPDLSIAWLFLVDWKRSPVSQTRRWCATHHFLISALVPSNSMRLYI